MLNPGHVAVLVRLELRRFRPVMIRMGATTIVLVSVLAGLGAREPLHFVLLAVGVSVAVQMPMELVRDRISGDLHLLSGLPVPAATVVAAKFLCSAGLCVLTGVMYAASAALALPDLVPSVTPLEAAVGTFFTSWLFFTVSSFVSAALLARLGMQTLTSGTLPLAILGLLFGASWLLELWIPDPRVRLEWLLAQPWLPEAAGVGSLVAAALASTLAFRVAVTGIREYRPEPDALSW